MMPIYGAIEAGGTKFVCGIGDAAGSRDIASFPTRDPDTTFADVAAFFARHEPPSAIGLATFGPVALDPASPAYGRILRTAKTEWEGADMVGRIRAFADVPIGLDTDVNGAALAEASIDGVDDLAYVTVGTGIGVGVVASGRVVHGAGHPEVGHLRIRPHPDHRSAGTCPFHGDCLEGLASGPAMRATWGAPAETLPDDHPGWAIETDYLAQLCMTLILTLAPRRIVLGGGVMQRQHLMAAVRTRTLALLGGYVVGLDSEAAMAARIVAPRSTEPSGLVGAYLLAAAAHGQLTAKQ